ncbi:HAD-IIA family hydrolase [Paenibacillus flagellatus]|uniref:Acid sugar phosphatase n=1 Tax=Paenibacillus flagellatus TaxID=2211139 RepID=A0A2V5K8Q0_9BACL|nr:HAD-IIA family hydrolase [Paenibacillus flagellatus]PYI55889.1 TIGR01457 family HAD-type hydrolase [Paenibacillus flagellatus]
MNANGRTTAFLIDLDGTMYAGNTPIPHAAAFVDRLRELALPFLFVTNNSSRTPEAVASHLREMGIAAEPGEVVTSSQATARYVLERGRGRRVYAIGEDGLKRALAEAGLELVEDEPDFVVQGIDRDFSYRKLEAAVRFIAAGAEYVLTNPDRLLPSDGKLVPGAGAISGSIREALWVEPTVIGKPSDRIMRFALERLSADADVWAVGDNPATDIGAGVAAGLRTALVLTGIATPDNAAEAIAAAGVTPDLVCGSLLELLERLKLGRQG